MDVASYLLYIDAMACAAENETRPHGLGKPACLVRDLFLLLAREVDEMVILCSDQKGNGSFVETSALSVPLLDRIECALSCQVEHEENGHGVVAYQGQHIDKFSLATQVPDREGDFCVSYRDSLLHEIDSYPELD